MGKYLTLFSNHSSYEEYINGPDAILPNVSYCEDVKHVHFNPIHDYSKDYLTLTFFESGTLRLSAGSNAADPDAKLFVEYNINDNEWKTAELYNNYEPKIKEITVNNGDIIKFRGNNNGFCSWEMSAETGELKMFENQFFYSDASFSVEGNIMSLISSNDYEHINSLSEEYNTGAFCGFFESNDKLISAENLILPATTLAESCYEFMFGNCTSLTTAPELPATTLAERCYSNMFDGCTSLTSAPELPATTLTSYCYSSMFYGCTGLTTAPELPATTLANGCYGFMFQDCTNLNYIKAMFTTTPSTTYTPDWVENVSSTGTFVKNSAATWNVTGADGIPNGWTVETA